MSGIFGMNIKMAIYGESHGKSIGVVLDGLPPGLALDEAAIAAEMARRAPGQNALSTARKESDTVEIQSGFFNGFTTGTPLCARIVNSDQHSKDYSILTDKMRPGHADYAGHVRYQGFNDYRGGGHFSGRLTAPLVFAGAVAKQALAQYGIIVGSHILQINDIKEERFNPMGVSDAELAELHTKKFAVMDDAVGEKMQERILQAKSELNSVGGVIEAIALHLPAGIGAPLGGQTTGVDFREGIAVGIDAGDQNHSQQGQGQHQPGEALHQISQSQQHQQKNVEIDSEQVFAARDFSRANRGAQHNHIDSQRGGGDQEGAQNRGKLRVQRADAAAHQHTHQRGSHHDSGEAQEQTVTK